MSREEKENNYNQEEDEEEEEEGGYGDEEGDGDYEYQYEDDVDDIRIPEMKREISESHFDIPEGSYYICRYTDIAPLMDKLILEVSSLLGVDKITSELLLRHTKWNQGILAEKYYNDSNKLLIAAGIELEDKDIPIQSNVCLVCYDPLIPGTGYSLNCKHEFCR